MRRFGHDARCAALLTLLLLTACRVPAPENVPAPWRVVPIGLCEDYPEASRTPEAARRDLEFLRQAGVRVLRVSIPWDAVEPEKDRYDWVFWDFLVAEAERAGVRLIPYVAYTPEWNARPGLAAHWTSPPRHLDEFAELMGLLAARYRGRIASWEIWNEPDNADYWAGSVEDYGKLLAAGDKAVRQGDPRALVVSGGLAGGLPFLAQLVDQGTVHHADVINLHGYFETWNPAPLESVPAYVTDAARLVGRHERPQRLWMAEIGYSNFRRGTYVSDWVKARFAHEHTRAFQAVILMRTMALLLAQPEIDLVTWYELKDPPDRDAIIGDVNNRHLGVATHDYQPKPALQALRFANQLFAAGYAPLDVRVKSTRPDTLARAFRLAARRRIAVAWLAGHTSTPPEGEGARPDDRRARVDLILPGAAGPARSYSATGEDRGPVPTQRDGAHTTVSLDLRADDVHVVELAPS